MSKESAVFKYFYIRVWRDIVTLDKAPNADFSAFAQHMATFSDLIQYIYYQIYINMAFILRPVLSEMKDMYSKPISEKRFQEYLFKLQGNTKGELVVPIMGFNPMAKEHVLLKLEELEELNAEVMMQDAINEVNLLLDTLILEDILVVLNLADDLKGAWTNHSTTDFENKFNSNALVKRHFCTPYFWTSESYTDELIKQRTKEYAFRNLYARAHPTPIHLKDFVAQEVLVAKHSETAKNIKDTKQFDFIHSFYEKNKQSNQYDLIFNFFYGDRASESLTYTCYGIEDVCGFDYARHKATSGFKHIRSV